MYIKDIENIKNKNENAQKEFYENCTIEEKIDAYYVSVEIISNNILKFRKSNKELTQVDLIINKNWALFINDWTTIFNANKDLFKPLLGYRLNMFYFPNSSPLSTYYKDGFKYLIRSVSNGYEHNKILTHFDYLWFEKFYEGLNNVDENLKSQIKIYRNINFDNKSFVSQMQKNNISLSNYSEHLLDFINKDEFYIDSTSSKAIEHNCLEIILRYGKTLYQYRHRLNNSNIERTTIEDEITMKHKQLAFEVILQDFIRYATKDYKDRYIDFITKDYVESVNNIFLDYIGTKYNEREIDSLFVFLYGYFQPSDLTPPCLGTPPTMNVKHIRNNKIIELFEEHSDNVWLKNIYKILLVNLKLYKKPIYSHYMSKNEIDKWNNIVTNIKIRVGDDNNYVGLLTNNG